MKVYCASKVRNHREHWTALRAAGIPIVASWIDWDRNSDRAEAIT